MNPSRQGLAHQQYVHVEPIKNPTNRQQGNEGKGKGKEKGKETRKKEKGKGERYLGVQGVFQRERINYATAQRRVAKERMVKNASCGTLGEGGIRVRQGEMNTRKGKNTKIIKEKKNSFTRENPGKKHNRKTRREGNHAHIQGIPNNRIAMSNNLTYKKLPKSHTNVIFVAHVHVIFSVAPRSVNTNVQP